MRRLSAHFPAKWSSPVAGRSTPPGAIAEKRRSLWRFWYLAPAALVAIVAAGVTWEVHSSALQARVLSRVAETMTFHLRQGPAAGVQFPTSGPYDERLGYTAIPKFIDRLGQQGYAVERQAEVTPDLRDFIERGGYAVYREKSQAGLTILDRDGVSLYAKHYPDSAYRDFEAVPANIGNALMFIEDRQLLDPRFPEKNPAVDWKRFTIAAAVRLTGYNGDLPVSGGASTLATQLEKFRHSPGGRTSSTEEKVRQMATASLRAYMNGPDSMAARQRILVDYLNSTPLGSRSGYGEVNGIADGLEVWFGTNFAEANQVLNKIGPHPDAKTARIYKQVLSLLLAQRRPAFYLRGDLSELDRLANTYLSLLEQSHLIDVDLARAARATRLQLRSEAPAPLATSFTERKAVDAIRAELLGTLEAPGLYSLDRLDLTVHSTIDQSAQTGVTKTLKALGTRDGAKQFGLVGTNMLGDEDPSRVIYSVALYERGTDHHALRVHADSMDAPFNINSGAKLILGSTAKLRTVATYLNIVFDLHQKYAALADQDLRAAAAAAHDPLTSWATTYLSDTHDKRLKPMLDAAMQRRYSASPAEAFFTGGGLHRFVNFSKDDNGTIPTLEVALRHSINLPMVRLMRDIVRYYAVADEPAGEAGAAEEREQYLHRFADKEGREYLNRFYGEYHGLNSAQVLDQLARRAKPAPHSLAVAYLSVLPQASATELKTFLNAHLQQPVDDGAVAKLQAAYGPGHYSLTDSAYIAGVHPLELWLAAYLQQTPNAPRGGMLTASTTQRQDVYQWLFKTTHRIRQDERIKVLREEDAFKRILEEWRGQGYPFTQIIPSYATALGSSGDRPDALARLMGIIINDGVDVPIATIESLQFGARTPYETDLKYAPQRRPVRVFAPEVAATLRTALLGVVEEGTAVRIRNVFTDARHAPLPVGGKTGTGDNRFKTFDSNGDVIDSRSVDRTATFAFFIGDRFFGTVTAYVPGPESDKYSFTSSIVVQLLKSLSPDVQKLMRETPPSVIALGQQ